MQDFSIKSGNGLFRTLLDVEKELQLGKVDL